MWNEKAIGKDPSDIRIGARLTLPPKGWRLSDAERAAVYEKLKTAKYGATLPRTKPAPSPDGMTPEQSAAITDARNYQLSLKARLDAAKKLLDGLNKSGGIGTETYTQASLALKDAEARILTCEGSITAENLEGISSLLAEADAALTQAQRLIPADTVSPVARKAKLDATQKFVDNLKANLAALARDGGAGGFVASLVSQLQTAVEQLDRDLRKPGVSLSSIDAQVNSISRDVGSMTAAYTSSQNFTAGVTEGVVSALEAVKLVCGATVSTLGSMAGGPGVGISGIYTGVIAGIDKFAESGDLQQALDKAIRAADCDVAGKMMGGVAGNLVFKGMSLAGAQAVTATAVKEFMSKVVGAATKNITAALSDAARAREKIDRENPGKSKAERDELYKAEQTRIFALATEKTKNAVAGAVLNNIGLSAGVSQFIRSTAAGIATKLMDQASQDALKAAGR